MPLKNNPKKCDKKRSYVRNGVIEDLQQNFGRKTMKNMEFSKEDMANVKSKIRKHKSEQRKSAKKEGDEPRGLSPAKQEIATSSFCNVSIAVSLYAIQA